MGPISNSKYSMNNVHVKQQKGTGSVQNLNMAGTVYRENNNIKLDIQIFEP